MFTTAKKISVSIIAASVLSVSAQASNYMAYDVVDEVKSCVAETNSRVNTENATRIRHIIRDYQSSAIGYAIKIESAVITPDSESNYSVYCVANGNNAPIKFRIKEKKN